MAGRRRRYHRGILPKVITMAAVIVAVVVCISLFFKVEELEVEGNSHYTAEQILEASGIALEDNLVSVSKSYAAAEILAKLPYVSNVTIQKILPDRLVVRVEECSAAGIVSDRYGGNWLISSDAKVLEEATEETKAVCPTLTGFSIQNIQLGATMETEDLLPEEVTEVLQHLETSGIMEHIVSISFEETYNITMIYEELYEIVLGGTDEMEYKFTYLVTEILPYLQENEPGQGGRIDLSLQTDKVARFLPW